MAFTLSLVLTQLALAPGAAAIQSAEFEYTVASSCPSRQQFVAQVAAALGRSAGVEASLAPLLKRVESTPAADSLRLIFQDGSSRKLDASTCDEATHAAALVLAFLLDSPSHAQASGTSNGSVTPAASSDTTPKTLEAVSPAASVLEVPVVRPKPAQSSAPLRRPIQVRKVPAPPTSKPHSEAEDPVSIPVELALRGELQNWLAPKVRLGFGGSLGLQLLDGQFWVHAGALFSRADLVVEERQASLAVYAGCLGLEASNHWFNSSAFQFRLSSWLQVGALNGRGLEGSALARGNSKRLLWLAWSIGPSLYSAEWWRLRLGLGMALVLPLTRYDLSFSDPAQSLHRIPSAALSGGLNLVLRID